MELGVIFEREIREQPDVWERLAGGDAARRLAAAIDGDALLVGSGSSYFAAQLGAVALRRRGIGAHALAATEAQGDSKAYQGKIVIAISQSGRSSDVLAALDVLHPRRVIAVTNTVVSPLGERSDVTLDVAAGPEYAIPATKSVTATAIVLLSAASLLSGDTTRSAAVLIDTARAVRAWLREAPGIVDAANAIAARRDVMVLGTDYGAPIARETALKFKEATYLHAEGFEAGEFRHGSAAMLDATSVVLAVMDHDGETIVARPLREAAKTGALRYVIGARTIDELPRLGPVVDEAFNTLAWLVTAQMLALFAARARGIDSDTPRGLTKSIVNE